MLGGPNFTLKHVQRQVRNGCIVVLDCFDLLEAQSGVNWDSQCVESHGRSSRTFPSTFVPWS